MSINIAAISGNLTRDPELRTTGAGSSVLKFSVAVNERRRNQQTDEWEDCPNFIDCVVFGNRAEPLSRILTKGMKVAVHGKLRWSSWETDDGQRRSKVELAANEVDIMAKREDGGQRTGGTRYQQQVSSPAVTPAPQGTVAGPGVYQPTLPTQPQAGVYDEDIPF